MLFLELDQIAQRSKITVHRENRFRHDEHSGTALAAQPGVAPIRPPQDFRQTVQIVVGEDAEFGAAKTGRIDQTGVHEFVQDDHIVSVEQGANGSQGRRITGRKRQGGLGAFESGDGLFQLVVRRERTADQPGRTRSGAITLDPFDRGLLQQRMIGQPEIIVGRKVQERFALDLRVRQLR